MARVIAYPWMTLEKWREFHTGDLARAAAGPVDVLFIGDSITEAWEKNGQKVWDDAFGKFNAANFGIGGDTTQNVLWRITEGGALDKVRPRVVVLMIGTNNFGLMNDSEEAVERGVSAIVATLRKKLPEAKILLLDIFPRGNPGDGLRKKVESVNPRIAKIGAGDPAVRHLRIWDEFLDSKGNAPADIMPDKLHLSEKGYRIWADALTPVLREMLGKR